MLLCYTVIMEGLPNTEDPLAVAELIRQAEVSKNRWKKPSNEPPEHLRAKSWKEILEGRTAPKVSGSRQN